MSMSGLAPRWASPPGATIAVAAAERGLDEAKLARRLGLTTTQLVSLLNGGTPITLDLAESLSSTVGATREFWITRDAQYHDDLRRVHADNWAKRFPVKQMAEFGWMPMPADWHEQISSCLQFFDVDAPEVWTDRYEQTLLTAHFRRSPSFDVEVASTTAWFRACEAQAGSQETGSYDPNRFASVLPELRQLTTVRNPSAFLPKLVSACAETGVALVVVRPPTGCPVSGVARRFHGRPLIQLSARHLSDDHFWFSMFHEAGHVLLHSLDEVYIDSFDAESFDRIEAEANSFAEEQLLPAGIHLPPGRLDARAIIRLANANGVAPGVVVGQLQHKGMITHGQFNTLKRRFAWNRTSLEMK